MMMLSSFPFVIVFIGSVSVSASNDCWWGGCLPHSWPTRGCYLQHKYYQADSKPCSGGDMYRCCPRSGQDEGGGGSDREHGTDNQVDDNTEIGICSFYGAGEIPPGSPTASGQPFDRFGMNAAHKTLPFGTRIRVKHEKTKETVDVMINDRGPFIRGRIVDLTYGAFGTLEKHSKGLFKCSYTIL